MEREAECPQCKLAMATEMDLVLPSIAPRAAGGGAPTEQRVRRRAAGT
jgi:hypothetical protein